MQDRRLTACAIARHGRVERGECAEPAPAGPSLFETRALEVAAEKAALRLWRANRSYAENLAEVERWLRR